MHERGGGGMRVYMRNCSFIKKIQPSIMFCSALQYFFFVLHFPFPSFPSFQRDQCEGLSKKDTKIISMAECQYQPAEASQGNIWDIGAWKNLANITMSSLHKLIRNWLVSVYVWGGVATPPPPPTGHFHNNSRKDDSRMFSRFLHAWGIHRKKTERVLLSPFLFGLVVKNGRGSGKTETLEA